MRNRAKKTVKHTVLGLCLGLVSVFAINSCDKLRNLRVDEFADAIKRVEDSCVFDNLPWLREKADEMAVLLSQSEVPASVYIYRCIYRDSNTGFLIDEGNTGTFYNYDGEVLCIIDEDTEEFCSELNIVRKKLIWEMNMPITTDCDCSRSSLQKTVWRLVGIVDATTGEITEIEPKDCKNCFTLSFDTAAFWIYPSFDDYPPFPYFKGTTVDNDLFLELDTSSCTIIRFGDTRMIEHTYGGSLYFKTLRSARLLAQSICLQGGSLKIYCNNRQNYLLYRNRRIAL